MIRAFLLALLVLAAPAFGQDAAQPSGAISTEAAPNADAAIQSRIEGIIGALDGYGAVQVTVSEGIVTFSGEVLDASDITRLDELAARVEGVIAVENDVDESTNIVQRLDPVAERFTDRLAQFIDYLPLLTVAVLAGLTVMVLGVLLARWDRPWQRLAPNGFIADIYRVILRLAFVLAGVVVTLDILNATAILTGLLGAAGLVGLAVGFAVRDTVENFIASVMLSLRQPFRPHDFVDIEGSAGSVIRLTSRATILLDPDGNHVRLPNSFVFKAKIINYTRNAERRFGFTLGLDPEGDLALAKQVALEALQALDFVLDDPAPQVWLGEAGDSTVSLEVYGWLNQRESDFALARGEALRLVMAALTRNGIAMPVPTYRLTMAGGSAPAGRANEGPSGAEPPVPPALTEEVAADQTIARMVEEERRAGVEEDLLNHSAPRE